MKTISKIGLFGAAAILLGGCASMTDIQAVDQVKVAKVAGGTAFTQALAGEYRRYAIHESEVAGEWDHAARFARKGLIAAEGGVPEIETPKAWGVPADRMDVTTEAYNTLVGHFAHGAHDRKPVEAAHAQVMLECWMEEEAEGDDTSTCMANFKATEPALRGMPMAKPVALPALPDAFIIYFDFDSSDITADAQKVADAVAHAVMMTKATRVVLTGHADRAGDVAYNETLSQARVKAASDAILRAGVGAMLVSKSASGETSPRVQTGDGVKEAQNRRVEITLER